MIWQWVSDLASGGILGSASGPNASFWMPEAASNHAAKVDWAFDAFLWLSLFFFTLITGLVLWFAYRYRHRPGTKLKPSSIHNTQVEVIWTVIPVLLCVWLFWVGYQGFLDMVTPPKGAYEVTVNAQKWNWLFTYPNGYIDPNLHVEVGEPVRLIMTSADVIHSFFVPAFRVKRDVMPGRYTDVWFEATVPGEYDIPCAEYCGTSHSTMLAKVIVHPVGEFEPWLVEASDFLSRMPPAEAGQQLYEQRGCPQCHSMDGSAGIGPTFLGLFGSTEQLEGGGSVLVDENYVRESILNPQANVTLGFDPVMPTFQGRLRDEEIAAIIEFMKTLSE